MTNEGGVVNMCTVSYVTSLIMLCLGGSDIYCRCNIIVCMAWTYGIWWVGPFSCIPIVYVGG